MTAERGQLIGGNTGQPRRPILRIGEDGRHRGEFLGKGGLLVVQLRADIETHREARREGFVEGGAECRIGVADVLRTIVFIVDDRHGKRAVPGKECCGGAMGGDRNGVEARFARKALQRIERKGPETLHVVMRIETGFDRDIRPFQDGDLAPVSLSRRRPWHWSCRYRGRRCGDRGWRSWHMEDGDQVALDR